MMGLRNPPRYGEGDQPKAGGGAGTASPSLCQPLHHRLRRRSPSPYRGGSFALALLLAAPALAQSSLPPARYAYTQLEDSRQEAQAKALMETLRCLVCQGQSIADSDAEMAGDMRAFVRERIKAGEKPERIRAWLVERYGVWVSYKPPVEPLTWPLWAAPILLLLGGFWLARGRFKRRRRGG